VTAFENLILSFWMLWLISFQIKFLAFPKETQKIRSLCKIGSMKQLSFTKISHILRTCRDVHMIVIESSFSTVRIQSFARFCTEWNPWLLRSKLLRYMKVYWVYRGLRVLRFVWVFWKTATFSASVRREARETSCFPRFSCGTWALFTQLHLKRAFVWN